MSKPKFLIQTLVPSTPEAWFGIAGAMHHLRDAGMLFIGQTGPQAEWRGHLQGGVTKYDQDQPRVPAGHSGGGQWTSGNGDAATTSHTEPYPNRRIALTVEQMCELQYQKDLEECALAGSAACYVQAMLRYSNCLVGKPIPPLNY